MDVIQMEVDLDAALLVFRKADVSCLLNRYAQLKLSGAAEYLKDQLYIAMDRYFADPNPVKGKP